MIIPLRRLTCIYVTSLKPDCFLFGANCVVPLVSDLVLKDKIFVYDLANMRMGWADYDCKMFLSSSLLSSVTPISLSLHWPHFLCG